MYNPFTISENKLQNNQDISTWDYRQELLKQKIRMINADVVCLQEVSPQSFDQDFLFMKEELGYSGCEMFKRGRFRPATFWKEDKCSLVGAPVHKDRTLLTVFELKDSFAEEEEMDEKKVSEVVDHTNETFGQEIVPQYWHVLNCHLQAGLQAKRRLRQIEEGVKASCRVAKEQHKVFVNTKIPKKKKNKNKNKKQPKSQIQPEPPSKGIPSKIDVDALQYPNLIVCGDFNGGSECAAVRFLEDGLITPDFSEDGHPATSKVKKLPDNIPDSSAFLDVPSLSSPTSTSTSTAPDTMIVSELISNMIHPDSSEDEPKLSNGVLEKLERIYNRLATTSTTHSIDSDSSSSTNMAMGVEDVERWLCQINGKVGRGTEFRNAAAEMGWTPPPPPPESDSNDTTKETVRPPIIIPPNSTLSLASFNKVYQMELHQGKFWGIAHDLAVLGEPMPDAGLYKARFDRMYCTSNLRPYAVVHTESDSACPNAMEPSDHLPVAASFTLN